MQNLFLFAQAVLGLGEPPAAFRLHGAQPVILLPRLPEKHAGRHRHTQKQGEIEDDNQTAQVHGRMR